MELTVKLGQHETTIELPSKEAGRIIANRLLVAVNSMDGIKKSDKAKVEELLESIINDIVADM